MNGTYWVVAWEHGYQQHQAEVANERAAEQKALGLTAQGIKRVTYFELDMGDQ